MQNDILDAIDMSMDDTTNKISDTLLTLPSVTERIKAALIDMLFIIAIMFLLSEIIEHYTFNPDTKKYIFIALFGLYDPLFTTFFGGTIGHFISGLRVKRETNITKNIILPFAFIRFAFKIGLGWISLLTIGTNSKSKAIHDMIIGSMVVYK
jgi:uncharacterized RDD family membrane protein YckC